MTAMIKRAKCLIALICCCILCTAQVKESNAAILMVHFGTSEAQGREKSLEAINASVKSAFPDMEVRQAYSSGVVRNILRKQGLAFQSPLEALMQLCAEGYQKVYVQSTTLMEGIEMRTIREAAASVSQFFEELKVGNPLLYSQDDCHRVLDILTQETLEKSQNAILIGHGTSHPSTATYAMLQMMLDEKGLTNWQVATIEGYPTQTMVVEKLRYKKPRKVLLVPLLLTAGDHARNDIAVEWKDYFEQQGYNVSVLLRGIGEIKAIRDIYISHIRDLMR